MRARVSIGLVHRVLAVASAAVLLGTGAGYALYATVAADITTTDVIAGGTGGEQNILLVGIDSRSDAQGNPLPAEVLRELRAGPDEGFLHTDTIMLLHLPEEGGAGVVFSIPRDAYVAIPGHGTDKINAAYPLTTARVASELRAEGETDRRQIDAEAARQGRRALIGTVEDLTGIEIDHYAEVNLAGFVNLTRAIGGVEICLSAPVAEKLSGARFPAGHQTISGADALAFVRQRHGLRAGDLSRIRRQQVFLAAVADKVLSGGTLRDPATLARLVDVAHRSLVIDEGWEVLEFAGQIAGIAAGHLDFATVPTNGTQTNVAGAVVLVDRAEVRRFVDRRIAGLTAPAPAPAQPATAPGPAPPIPCID